MRSDAVGPCCFVAGCCRCWMVHVFKRRQKLCKPGAARRVRIWLVQLRSFNGTKHVIERVQVFYCILFFLLRCNAYVNVDVCDLRSIPSSLLFRFACRPGISCDASCSSCDAGGSSSWRRPPCEFQPSL